MRCYRAGARGPMKRRCAICGGACRPFLDKLYDDRHGFPGRVDLAECAACGHRQLDAAFTGDELVRLYSDYYPRRAAPEADFSPHRETAGWRAWLDGEAGGAFRAVPPRVRVLDIGSGAGRALAYHRARGCEAWGVEADENARAIAERHGLQVKIGTFDAVMFEPASFDWVTLDQVIEHAADPVAFLRGAASLLKPDGRAVLTTPNSRGWGARLFGRRWIHWHVPYHLHQFSRGSLGLLAEKAGLLVASLRTLTHSAWLNYQWLHLTSRPPAGRPSPFWDPARAARALPRWHRRLAALVDDLQVNHIATRSMDALGAGDNFLCILLKPA